MHCSRVHVPGGPWKWTLTLTTPRSLLCVRLEGLRSWVPPPLYAIELLAKMTLGSKPHPAER